MKERGGRPVEPPTPAEILNGGKRWLAAARSLADRPLVLPRLERCYLRHHDGLDLVRRLLEWLCVSRPPVVLACDSWAWAYLDRSLEIDATLPPPVALAAFDPLRLQAWLQALCASCKDASFVFRLADTGAPVFETPEAPSDFLRHLSGRSRGILEVAWAIWRQSLRIAHDEVEDAAAREVEARREEIPIWVCPWSRLSLPEVPRGIETAQAFVLHALLQHGGVAADVLPLVLPLRPGELGRALSRLQAAGVIHLRDDEWAVTALGYPSVRQHLGSEGYLVDAL